MPNWCLPRKLSKAFLDAVRDGRFSPDTLMDMTSDERRTAFADILGADNAREVNAQFEQKMLLTDKQRGLVNWAKSVGGISEDARRDIIDTIGRMKTVMQPAEEEAFLADLAAKKLGVTVTADEARAIFDLAKNAQRIRDEISAAGGGDYRAGWTAETGTEYGRAKQALIDKIESMKPGGQTFTNRIIDVLNIPKSALTSILHFSAPFVQGWGMLSTKQAWLGFGKMFQFFADERNYQNLNAYIVGHPDYALSLDAKLGITKLGDKLSAREEAIQSTLVEQANQWLSDRTGVPNLVRASSRAFTGYLNYVRFSRFVDLLNSARQMGEDVSEGSKLVSDFGKVVNDFTGRGNQVSLGVTTVEIPRGAAPILNAVFFSPRKIAATMEMFNPIAYAKMHPVARVAALRQLVGSLAATGAVLSIAKAMGASVNPDPRSADFGKVVIGGEKLDMTGGNAGYVRLLARIITNQEISASGVQTTLGDGPFSATRASLVGDYFRNKLSPVAGFLADAMYGKDPVGREFSLTTELHDKLMPITIDAGLNYLMNDPGNTAAILPALTALFGVGLESPLPPMSHSGMDVWGQPLNAVDLAIGATPPAFREDPVNQQAKDLGVSLNFPMDKIRGVKLTPDQFNAYVQLSGRMAHMRLESLVQSPSWSAIPPARRQSLMKGVIRKSRDIAATSIMMNSHGGPNDILSQAADAKAAKNARLSAQP